MVRVRKESGVPARKKVLVVDDDSTLRRMITSRLQIKNYDVITATHGAEALQRIKEENPQLIILDVMMPEMTGYDLVKKMKELPTRLRQIPIILMTGKESMMDFFESWEIQATIPKPFDGAVLVAKVEEIIGPSAGGPMGAAGSVKKTQKRLMIISHQSFVTDYTRNYFEPKQYAVTTAGNPTEAVQFARATQPDFIFANFCDDPSIMSVEGIYRRLQDIPVTRNIPFVIFCERLKVTEAAKAFQNIPNIVYDRIEDAVKKMETFLNAKVIQ